MDPAPAPQYDIAIVGYGPVSQVLAALLGSYGHRIVVLERWHTLYPRPRAGHFDHEIYRVLEQLGVLDAVRDDLVAVRGYDWIGADGAPILRAPAETVAASGWPEGTLFYQPTLEQSLNARVRSESTVTVLQGWAVQHVVQHDQLVIVEAERTAREIDGGWEGTGERLTVSARYLIGADGANSIVREQQGIERENLGFSEHWLVIDVAPTGEAEIDRLDRMLSDSVQWCDPRRPHMSVRIGRRHRRWEFMLLPDEHPEDFHDADTAWALLAPWTDPTRASIERHVVYEFSSQLAANMRVGRVLLAGDAAHVMPPFIGQGLCSGIRDAANLAWKLDLVLRGESGPELLDTITPERVSQNTAMVEASLRMGRVSCTLSPRDAERRDAEFRAGNLPSPYRAPGITGGLQFHAAGDPLAGQLAVQGRIRLGERSGLADAVIGPGFCLIVSGSETVELLSDESRTLLRKLRASVLRLNSGAATDLDGRLTTWLAEAGVEAVLVRPDFYVFGSVENAASVNELLLDLRAQLCLLEPGPASV